MAYWWYSACVLLSIALYTNGELVGGETVVSPDSESLQEAIQFTVAEYNRISSDQFAWKMVKIVSAEVQVGDELIYNLDMEMGQTQCKKGKSADVQSCPLSSSDQTYLCHFEVLSIPWTQLPQLLKSSCTAPVHVPVLENAQLDGGVQDVSPLSLAVQKAAQFAVDQYNKDSKDQFAFKMLKIVSAREQVVAGMKYYLEMEMGQTQCKKGASTDVQSCPLSSSDRTYLCHFEVLSVPWTQLTQLLKSSCTAPVHVPVLENAQLDGGIQDVSPLSLAVQKAAQFAVDQYNKDSKDQFAFKMLKIVSAREQVVAGMKYYLEIEMGQTQCKKGASADVQSCPLSSSDQTYLCHFEVLSVPWTQLTQLLKSSCTAPVHVPVLENAQLDGGIQDVSPLSLAVQKAAQFAVDQYNKDSKDQFAFKMLKIVSAREQVVAGMKYYLEIEMGQTQCKKGASADVQSCPLSSSDQTYLCHFEVLSVPWTQLTQLLKSSCTAPVHVPVLENAQLDGGIQDVSPLSLAVQKVAQFAVDQYNKDSKDQFAFKMLKIVSAREQVVAGMKYYLEMEMGQTQCKKGASADVQSCPLSSSDRTYLCHFEVLSVPWTQLTQLLKSSCTAPVHVPVLENAQLDGGIQDVSPLSLAVQKAAQFAVDQYNKDSKDQFAFKMLKIVSAREQVVAGMKYYLEMEMGQTQCKKGASADVQSCPLSSSDRTYLCHFEVLSVPWTQLTQLLKSSCTAPVHVPVLENAQLDGGVQDMSQKTALIH